MKGHSAKLENIHSLPSSSFYFPFHSSSARVAGVRGRMRNELRSNNEYLKNIDMSKQNSLFMRRFPMKRLKRESNNGKGKNYLEIRQKKGEKKTWFVKFLLKLHSNPLNLKWHESNLIIITHHKAIFTFLRSQTIFFHVLLFFSQLLCK